MRGFQPKQVEHTIDGAILSPRWLLVVFYLGLAASLVASFAVMVTVSEYGNFITRFDSAEGELSWLGRIDPRSLKTKVASVIVAISSIHLPQVFLSASQHTETQPPWLTIMHMAFVVSALLLALIGQVTARISMPKGGG